MSNFIIDWQSLGLEGLPGKSPIVLGEQAVDTTSTSLTLTGKKLVDYGEIQQENFIRLLEHFASKDEPQNKTIGQLWFYYFGINRELRIWNGTSWQGMSITGPQGPQGPIGPRGIIGPPSTVAGPTGFTGLIGPQGVVGIQGTTGPAGPAGPRGFQGPTGITGINSLAAGGPTGPQGPQGPRGPTGIAGTNGSDLSFEISPYFTFLDQILNINIPALATAVAQNVSCADFTAALTRCASGGTGGGGCPAPWHNILLSDGTTISAGALQPGTFVQTQHETTLQTSDYEVTTVQIYDSPRVLVKFDELDFVCSLTHKFHVQGSDWIQAYELKPGMIVSGKTVLGLFNYEYGPVVKISVNDARTYICEGILSHNVKAVRPGLDDWVFNQGD